MKKKQTHGYGEETKSKFIWKKQELHLKEI